MMILYQVWLFNNSVFLTVMTLYQVYKYSYRRSLFIYKFNLSLVPKPRLLEGNGPGTFARILGFADSAGEE